MKKKRCAKCGHLRGLDAFGKQNGTRDGLRTWCKPCFVASGKAWRAANRERHNSLLRLARLRGRGVEITIDELEKLHRDQEDLCAICGNPETLVRINSRSVLSVDHCHTTGTVRGLLCRRCNTGIANFDEDLERLKAAIAYLSK